MRRQTGDKGPLLDSDGLSRRETIAGVAAVILILLPISMAPVNLLKSRQSARQASAVSSLRTINTAESTYADTYKAGYTATLAALGPPPGNAQPSASAAGLIDSVLASGVKSEYRITYVPGPPDKTGHIKTYTIVARPVEYNKSGKMAHVARASGPQCLPAAGRGGASRSRATTSPWAWHRPNGGRGRPRYGKYFSATCYRFAWVMAPSEADETSAAYLANTPFL